MQTRDYFDREWVLAAVELARRWGVMETLENIPSMHEVPVSDRKNGNENLLAWAKEYIDAGETDMTVFLQKKLEKYRK